MAKPVITAPVSPRIIAQGVAFSQALSASNTPTSWAGSGLPSGLALNTVTGAITGTPLVQVQTTATFTATNGDGTSDAATIIFVVMATPPGIGEPWDIMLDYELTTNEVSLPGVARPVDGAPLFWAPRGTNRYLLVGVTYFGVLQDLNPASEPIAIALGMKEIEPERLIEVTSAATVKVPDMPDDRQRYRIPFRVTPGSWSGALSDNEADAGTQILALSELQISRGVVAVLHDATLTDSSIAISAGMSATTGDHDFLSVEQFATATPMRLTLTLAIAGRVLQTIELVRTFDLIFSGGVFVLSNFAGQTAGTGASEGGKWRATLNLTGLTGDANSVDADYSIATTANATQYVLLPDWSEWGASERGLQLYSNSMGMITPLGALMGFGGGGDLEIVAASIKSAWESATGTADVISVTWTESPVVFKVSIAMTSPVVGFEWAEGITGVYVEPTPAAPSSTCSVTARLQQLEAPNSVPLNLTSNQFRIGVARDIVPDLS